MGAWCCSAWRSCRGAAGKVVEVGLSIASVAYGALLGVFLLGVLTRRANERGSMIGNGVGFVANAVHLAGQCGPAMAATRDWSPFAALALSRADPLDLVRADRQRDHVRSSGIVPVCCSRRTTTAHDAAAPEH